MYVCIYVNNFIYVYIQLSMYVCISIVQWPPYINSVGRLVAMEKLRNIPNSLDLWFILKIDLNSIGGIGILQYNICLFWVYPTDLGIYHKFSVALFSFRFFETHLPNYSYFLSNRI